MNALKNLIKFTFCVGLTLVPLVVKAQILGIGVSFEKFDLPEQFYQSLENCTEYTYAKPAKAKNVAVNTTYKISPLSNGMCHLSVEGTTNVSVRITQNCDLSSEQAKTYSGALRRYQNKNYSPRWDKNRIETDEDYKMAYSIMSNRKICRFIRDKIDHTKKIRDNLLVCTAIEETETTAAITVKRKIIAREDEVCHYQFSLQKHKTTNDAKSEDDKRIVYNCRLSREQSEQYLQILEAMVVPEEEGYDFAAVQRISPAEEMNFILDNCTLDTN